MREASKTNPRSEKRMREHIAALGSEDEEVAIQKEYTLIRHYAANPRLVELLLPACDSPEPQVRFRAAWILGKTHDPRAFDALLRLTRDPDSGVRYDATWALGHLGDARVIAPLLQILHIPDTAEDGGGRAAQALVQFGKPAVPALLNLLATTNDPQVKISCALVLSGIGDETAIDALAALLSDAHERVRLFGVQALGEMGTARCRTLVEGSLQDASDDVRQLANYYLSAPVEPRES